MHPLLADFWPLGTILIRWLERINQEKGRGIPLHFALPIIKMYNLCKEIMYGSVFIVKEVLSILNDKSAIGYLATIDDGKPRVRPWGFMFEENGRLYFCTASTKDVYKQLTTVPYIEYSKTTKDMAWVRVTGEIIFEDDIKIKEKIFEHAPMLKNLYQSSDNPIFKVFYLEHGKATMNNFSDPQRLVDF